MKSEFLDGLQDTIEGLATTAGESADQVRADIRQFLQDIRPELEIALATVAKYPEKTHLNTLAAVRDSTILVAGMASSKFIKTNRDAITAAVMGALSTVIKLGLAAI